MATYLGLARLSLLILLSLWPRYSIAEPIGLLTDFELGLGIGGNLLDQVDQAVTLRVPVNRDEPLFPSHEFIDKALFANIVFTPASVGKTFVANRETDPFFD